MKELRNVRPLRWFKINGMVLWPFVLYADAEPSPTVKNHERIHVEQVAALGVVRFYSSYLKEYFRGRMRGLSHHESYMDISFEKEAYENQHDPLYAVTEAGAHTSPTNNRSRGSS